MLGQAILNAALHVLKAEYNNYSKLIPAGAAFSENKESNKGSVPQLR